MARPADKMTAESSLQFEGFTLDVNRLRLTGPSGRVDLRRKSFDVLRYLAEHAGRVVGKDDLMHAVWPDVTVSDESLTQCISEIRRALGDKGQRIIKTVARRGYLVDVAVLATPLAGESRGLGSVEGGRAQDTERMTLVSQLAAASREDAPSKGWASHRRHSFVTGVALAVGLAIGVSAAWTSLRALSSPTLTMMAVPTVAILPFSPTGSDNQRSLAAGIDGEIQTELGRSHRGLDLIIGPAAEEKERSWWPRFNLARPEARYLVTGTIWVDAGSQRANVRLVETKTNRQIWSESYDLGPNENGAFRRTAARIAWLLAAKIQIAESLLPLPPNPEAGHYALLGRVTYASERGPEGARKARALFEKALSLDANSIPGLQGVAVAKAAQALNAWIPVEDRLSTLVEASTAADRSINLDARHVAGHLARGIISRALGEPDKAIASLEYALSLSPNLHTAHGELAVAKVDAGLAGESAFHIEEALRSAPPEPNIQILYFYAGYAALHAADDATAVKWFLKARQANPAYPNAALWLAAAYVGIGQDEAARASLAEYLREKPRFSIEGFKRFVPMPNSVVAKQRERIMDAWRRLGIPETPPSEHASQ
jgi:DNA-binding winged helix-turn-helix (wHTH) protein/tetratricopeptide (TPR) repeat protein